MQLGMEAGSYWLRLTAACDDLATSRTRPRQRATRGAVHHLRSQAAFASAVMHPGCVMRQSLSKTLLEPCPRHGRLPFAAATGSIRCAAPHGRVPEYSLSALLM